MVRWLIFALVLLLAPTLADAREASAPAQFEGLYLGLDTGYGFGSAGDWCFCSFVPAATDAAEGEGGITIAGDLGYAVRLGPLFFEPAIRTGYASMKFSETCSRSTVCDSELSWLAEAQLSVGVIVYRNLAIAGSFGVAAANVYAQIGTTAETSAVHNGSVVGARLEQGMPDGWRMGVEYRHYDMRGSNETPTGNVDIEWKTQSLSLIIRYELSD